MRGRETVERRGGRGGGNKGAEEQGRGWACSSRPSLPPRPPRSKRTPFTPGSLLAHKREKKEHTRRKQEQKGEWREERKEAVKEEAFSRSYLPYLGRPGVGARPRLRSGAIRESRGAPRADDDPFQAAILSPHSLFNPRPFTAHRILPPFALSSPSPIPISLLAPLPFPPPSTAHSIGRKGWCEGRSSTSSPFPECHQCLFFGLFLSPLSPSPSHSPSLGFIPCLSFFLFAFILLFRLPPSCASCGASRAPSRPQAARSVSGY